MSLLRIHAYIGPLIRAAFVLTASSGDVSVEPQQQNQITLNALQGPRGPQGPGLNDGAIIDGGNF